MVEDLITKSVEIDLDYQNSEQIEKKKVIKGNQDISTLSPMMQPVTAAPKIKVYGFIL